jgi:hypothetical protein
MAQDTNQCHALVNDTVMKLSGSTGREELLDQLNNP